MSAPSGSVWQSWQSPNQRLIEKEKDPLYTVVQWIFFYANAEQNLKCAISSPLRGNRK